MHGALTHEEDLLQRLEYFDVTYLHPDLIRTGNPSGQLMHAEIEELQTLTERLEGRGHKCITN